ncbi:hypothetical protein Taro_048327 [Colocasia esculenta]|uniref:Uncharacterized protein n=1 Tax=Colocasia esculenta TaxID=4460 RepID=A0A843X7T3_COLES|nr:hypothetical protein [Colocasia esculenta]
MGSFLLESNCVLCQVSLAIERVADRRFSCCCQQLRPLSGFAGDREGCWLVGPNNEDRDCLYSSRSGWIGSPSWFVDGIFCFSMLPSLMWCVCGVWVAPRWSILRVYPSSGVATGVRGVTPKGAILSQRVGPMRWRRDSVVRHDLVTARFPVAIGLLSWCPSQS